MAIKRPRGQTLGPVCTPLEMNVPVTYKIVGRRDWLRSAWEPGSLDQNQLIEVCSPSDLAECKEFFDKIKAVGCDTETTGHQIKGDKNYSMNPCNPDNRMVLAQLGNEDLVYLIEPDLLIEFKYLLESERWLKILHNAIYDHKWMLVKYGIHMTRVFCSMLAEQVLVAGLMAMRVTLADASRRHAPYWLINKSVRDEFITMYDTGRKISRQAGRYSARDVTLLFPLMRDQITQLKEKQLLVTAQDEFNTIWPTAEMEIQGVNLSLSVMRLIIEYWTQHESDLARDIFKVYGELTKHYGVESGMLFADMGNVFNLKSNAKKLEALKAIDIDLDNVKRDALKNVSKGFVERKNGFKTVKVKVDFTPEQRKLALLLAEYSNVSKMTSTYGKNMVDKVNPHTHRWHPRFRQLGSGEEEGRKSGGDDKSTIATGRFSSDAQQFPKPKTLYAPVCNAEELRFIEAQFADKIAEIRAQKQLKEAA